MRNEELVNILQEARREIINLRRHNEILSAKVDTMELMASVNRPLAAPQPTPMSVDIACRLDNAISEIQL